MTRILLLGANGQVGHELLSQLSAAHEVVPMTSSQLDLSGADDIRQAVRAVAPQIILNAAAFTAVDRAETDRDLAMAVNAAAPGVLAEEARRAGGALIHYSTGFVFDGRKAEPYQEQDAPNPLNVYGRSKHLGEQAIEAVPVPQMIFRTNWVYGRRGTNFVLTMSRLMRERAEIRVIDDHFGAPTWSRDVAQATVRVLSLAGDAWLDYLSAHSGIFHMTAGGRTSWLGFAQKIERTLRDRGDAVARVVGIPSSEYPTPAVRPANSVLDNGKMHRVFGFSLADWEPALGECLSGDNSSWL